MKKIVAIILAGLMLLSLAACGGKDDVVKIGFIDAGEETRRDGIIFTPMEFYL